jgi:protein-ribulosamine 3-kinase
MVKSRRRKYHFLMSLDALATAIGERLGVPLYPQPASRAHGGSINECYRWESNAGPLFVKLAPVQSSMMFEAEAAGLEELRLANAVRVPCVLGIGAHDAHAWLALEWIQPGAHPQASDSKLGEQLAQQHRRSKPSFGWSRNNTIGSTPQLNEWRDNWVEFLRDRRLGYQLSRAAQNGYGGSLQDQGALLLSRLGEFFAAYRPAASLLHGDLWGGNRMTDQSGQPVIFDPAVYYGDREADLAMTRLFGGFGAGFYRAYETAWPLDPGAAVRSDLYNLYHVLNHLNSFGGSYLGQALALIDQLLAELGH